MSSLISSGFFQLFVVLFDRCPRIPYRYVVVVVALLAFFAVLLPTSTTQSTVSSSKFGSRKRDAITTPNWYDTDRTAGTRTVQVLVRRHSLARIILKYSVVQQPAREQSCDIYTPFDLWHTVGLHMPSDWGIVKYPFLEVLM